MRHDGGDTVVIQKNYTRVFHSFHQSFFLRIILSLAPKFVSPVSVAATFPSQDHMHIRGSLLISLFVTMIHSLDAGTRLS